VIDFLPSEESISQAHKLSSELLKMLIEPVLKWVDTREHADEGLQLVTVINMTAILGAMCILEDIFGEEALRPYIENARREAALFANAPRH